MLRHLCLSLMLGLTLLTGCSSQEGPKKVTSPPPSDRLPARSTRAS